MAQGEGRRRLLVRGPGQPLDARPGSMAGPVGSTGYGAGPGMGAAHHSALVPSTGYGAAPRSDSGDSSVLGRGGVGEETRMMTSTTPLSRARSRAQGVMGQLKRLLIGRADADFARVPGLALENWLQAPA